MSGATPARSRGSGMDELAERDPARLERTRPGPMGVGPEASTQEVVAGSICPRAHPKNQSRVTCIESTTVSRMTRIESTTVSRMTRIESTTVSNLQHRDFPAIYIVLGHLTCERAHRKRFLAWVFDDKPEFSARRFLISDADGSVLRTVNLVASDAFVYRAFAETTGNRT